MVYAFAYGLFEILYGYGVIETYLLVDPCIIIDLVLNNWFKKRKYRNLNKEQKRMLKKFVRMKA